MSWLYRLLLLFLCMAQVELKRYHSIAGPYRINMKRMGECYQVPDDQRDKRILIKVKEFHMGRDPQVMYNGSFSTPIPFDDSMTGELAFSTWNGIKGWQDNAYNFRVNGMCLYLEKMFPSIWNKIIKGVLGEYAPCPYPAGFYAFENVKITSTDLPVKHFFYGKWRAFLHLFGKSKTEEIGCLMALVDTVPV